MVNLLRPRSPVQPSGGVIPGTVKGWPALVRQTVGGPKTTPGIKGEVVAPGAPATEREGRIWDAPRSRRVSSPVMTLKGLPEESSTSGARVKSLKKLCTKESPPLCGEVWKTPLVTQRWR